MATSGKSSPRPEEPATDMSDEVREMFCEPCRTEGIDATADGFCVKCMDYLCTTCLRYHKRFKPKHVLHDKTSMPQDFCFEKCEKHQAEMIKFYCEKCDRFMCSTCLNTDHTDCSEVKHLPTIVNDIENGKEFKSITDELARQKEEMLKFNHKLQSNYEKMECYRNFVKAAMKKRRKELNEELDTIEGKIDIQVEKIMKNDEAVNTSLSEKHSSLSNELGLLHSDIDRASRDRCKLFLATKKAHRELTSTEMRIRNMEIENTITNYKFKPSEGTKALVDTFGSLVVNDSERKRTASFKSDINVKSEEDKKRCDIAGICILCEDCLCVTDYSNKNLKLIDRNIVRSIFPVDTEPWGVTKVNDEEIAATLPYKKLIVFILVENNGFVSKHIYIKVNGKCYGIQYSRSNLFVSFIEPAKVESLDTTGNVLQTISQDTPGNDLFISPLHLALSSDRSVMIYVSEYNKNCIIGLSRKGNINTIYKTDTTPFGIAVDETGAVYFCQKNSNKLFQLSDELNEVKELLNCTNRLVKPYCCAVCNRTKRLYVGLEDQDYIKVFVLT